MDCVFPCDRVGGPPVGSLGKTSQHVREAQWTRLKEKLHITRKRRRSASPVGSSEPSERCLNSDVCRKRCEYLRLAYRFGNRPFRPSAVWQMHQAQLTGSQSAPTTHLFRNAVQEVLSLLRTLSALDTSQYLLHQPPAANHFSGSRLTRLYCGVQALLLELEDVERLTPKTTSCEDQALRDGLLNRCARMMDSFEATVVSEVVLALEHSISTSSAKKAFRLKSGATSADYRIYAHELLEEFQKELHYKKWPVQLLRLPSNVESTPVGHSTNAHDEAVETAIPTELKDIWTRDLSRSTNLEDFTREGVSVIATRAFQALRLADTQNLLGCVSHTTLSAVAAQQRPRGTGEYLLMPDAFLSIWSQVWSGAYNPRGLGQVLVDVQASFLQLLSQLQQQKAAGDVGEGCRQQQAVTELWDVWLQSVSQQYRHFAAGVLVEPSSNPSDHPEPDWGRDVFAPTHPLQVLEHPSAFVLLEAEKTPSSQLSQTQQAALRVMHRLRDRDCHQWFSFPTLTEERADFTSIEEWIQGSHFYQKSPIEAFDALRHVLDQMADHCIRAYGPVDDHSKMITDLRTHMVFAWKQEMR